MKYKVGDEVIITGNLGSHCFKIGDEGLIISSAHSDIPYIRVGENTQYVRENEFELITNNMKLEITKEKVLEAAGKCSTAKSVLTTLFPEAFEVEYPAVNKLHDSKSEREKLGRRLLGEFLNGCITSSEADALKQDGFDKFYNQFCEWMNEKIHIAGLPF